MSVLRRIFRPAAAAGLIVTAAALASCAQRPKESLAPEALTAKVAEVEAKLAYLSDRQQIHDVYLRYMRGVDRADVDMLRSAFWPEVQLNYGNHSITFDQFVIDHLDAQTKRWANYAHLITNESVDLKEDVAHVESYVTELISQKNGKSMIVSGRYIDRLDRRNGEWRIAVRDFIPHFWTETNTALDAYVKEGGWWSQKECGMGTWDKRDPSYRRPLDRRTQPKIGPGCTESTRTVPR